MIAHCIVRTSRNNVFQEYIINLIHKVSKNIIQVCTYLYIHVPIRVYIVYKQSVFIKVYFVFKNHRVLKQPASDGRADT